MKDIRVVSIGDLVTDYYYLNGNIVGVSGGMSSHNIIANLCFFGKSALTFGVSGNDLSGDIAIKSLKDIGVDISYIKVLNNIDTKSVHISYGNNKIYSEIHCPFCNNKKWYDNSLIDFNYVIDNIKENDVLVFDNLNEVNQKIIDCTNNIKFIDLGHIRDFRELSMNEFKERINNKFKIININNSVYDYLIDKFNLENINDIYELFDTELLVITEGKKGAKFIFDGKIYEFKLNNIIKEVDVTGAGDAFFSSIINDVIDNNFVVDDTKFYDWFNNATKLTSKVVTKMGARGHIHDLYKIKECDNCCICDKFILEEK